MIGNRKYVISHVIPRYKIAYEKLYKSGLIERSNINFSKLDVANVNINNQEKTDDNNNSNSGNNLERLADADTVMKSNETETEKQKEKYYPYVSLEEILRNGSVIRPELFPSPPVNSIRYEWGKTTCKNVKGPITSSAKDVLNRKLLIPGKLYV